MLNVGLTGGIASGKSTVAEMFVEKGALLIDFDVLAHTVEEPEEPAWREIVTHFGAGILQADGRIDRQKLGGIVFSDRERLDLLNAIVHPAVDKLWQERIDEIQQSRPKAIVLSDIPLLMEAGLRHKVDLVLLVYTSPERQMHRLILRNGCTHEEARRRLAAQMPIGEKIALADIVIRNEGTLAETRSAVCGVWGDLLEEEARRWSQMTM